MKGVLKRFWEFIKRPKIIRIALACLAGFVTYKLLARSLPQVAASTFFQHLKEGSITQIIDHGNTLRYKTQLGQWISVNVATVAKSDIIEKILANNIHYASQQSIFSPQVQQLTLALILTTLFIYYNNRGEGKRKLTHTTNILFKDIAGNEEAKQSLQEIIRFFKDPQRFVNVGAKLPKGVLLYGPSGTGKTMLAKATASESGVNFISAAGSEFIEMYVGVGARRVRDLFQQARQNAPCILFIDEIETIGVKRGNVSDRAQMEYVSTLDQLLHELDGFVATEQVVLLAATNKHTMIDEALLRPGRLDRKIEVGLPNATARADIIQLNLQNRAHNLSEDFIQWLSEETHGFSGAEIASVVNEGSYITVRDDRDLILEADITQALVKIKQQKVSSQQEALRAMYESLGFGNQQISKWNPADLIVC